MVVVSGIKLRIELKGKSPVVSFPTASHPPNLFFAPIVSTEMSNIYIYEPVTNGKVVIETTMGDIGSFPRRPFLPSLLLPSS